MESLKYYESGMIDYYITHITKFMEDDTTYFLELDRECDLVFLRGILKRMGFNVGNIMLQDTIKPQFLPYSYGEQEVYLHFNPVVFRIGLIKKTVWDKIPDEEPDMQRMLTAIHNDIMQNYTVEDCLVCAILYQWLHDKRTDLWCYNEATIRRLHFDNPTKEWFKA